MIRWPHAVLGGQGRPASDRRAGADLAAGQESRVATVFDQFGDDQQPLTVEVFRRASQQLAFLLGARVEQVGEPAARLGRQLVEPVVPVVGGTVGWVGGTTIRVLDGRVEATILRGRIESGDLAPNRPIPSETAMQQEHGVARGTARRAVALLREEGLMVTVKGRGTFVRPTKPGARRG
jgi:GntR family transcriptional regulator